MGKRKKKKRVNINDIIPEAFHDAVHYHNEQFKKSVKPEEIFNPYFYEKEIIVSIDYIDKYNNIVYTADNRYPRGSKSEDSNVPFISIAFPYQDYIDFEKPYRRENLINEIIN